MLKSIIIDDDYKSREGLKKILLAYCGEQTEVSAACRNIDEGLKAIRKYKPDLLFLDIELKGETGFDLLTKLNNIDFEVIFTTAHSEYALKAIKFSALDYLLKPVDIDELKNAVTKAEQRHFGDTHQRLRQLLQNLKAGNSENYQLALPTSDGLTFIKTQEILYCKASGNYTEIFMVHGEKYLVSRLLKEYDELLIDHNFYRVHHSYLINLQYIKSYVKGDGGYVIMADNNTIDVSRRKKEAFLERIGYKS